MTDRTPTQGPPPGSGPRTVRYADRGDGWTLAMELLTATFVWGGIGWLADRWLATAPVLMLLGFVLGNALGVYLIWVRSKDRFAQEHAELMARRARTRAAASGVVPPAPRPGPVPDPRGAAARADPRRRRDRRRAAVVSGRARRRGRRRDRGTDLRGGSP